MIISLKHLLIFTSVFFGIWAAGHAILNKRNPRGAALWLVIIILLPLAGSFLYWVLGINRIHRRALARARKKRGAVCRVYSSERIVQDLPGGRRFKTLNLLATRATHRPLLAGNNVEPLFDGNETFPAMLESIGGAKKSVTLSTYILDRDAVGIRVVDSLCAAAVRGIQVRVLVDGLGTSKSALKMASRLRDAGAKVSVFHPLPGLPFRRPSINMRNHRKILVIDGQLGFTGGINISGRHFFSKNWEKELVRDIHFRITGPVVEGMQDVFAEDWYASAGEVLEGDVFFSRPREEADAYARAVASGPDENFEKIYEIIIGAIHAAGETITIVTPYFIPDRPLVQALRSAVLTGVEVRIFLPVKSDHTVVTWASNAHLSELLDSGVSIFWTAPPFVHSKLMIIDGFWSLIGSANIDPRSFRLNFEFDIEVYNSDLAEKLTDYADGLKKEAIPLNSDMLLTRPLYRRLCEGVARMFAPYL
jgi:cardiolipin synthase A/B